MPAISTTTQSLCILGHPETRLDRANRPPKANPRIEVQSRRTYREPPATDSVMGLS